MWMLNMHTKPQFLQNSSFRFNHLILQLYVVLIQNHWCYWSAQIQKTNKRIFLQSNLIFIRVSWTAKHNNNTEKNLPVVLLCLCEEI